MESLIDLAGRTVLVVDDDPLSRQILSRYLSRAKVNVVEAERGADALMHLRRTRIDLVLMDMQMPEPGGIEITRMIRQTPSAYQQVRIAMLTANIDESSRDAACSAGANAFMSKPIMLDPAYREIRQLLHDAMPINNPVSDQQTPIEPLLNQKMLEKLDELGLLQVALPRFESQSEKWMGLLPETIATQDLQQVNYILHSYQGACSSIGAQALYAMLQQAHQAVQMDKWPSMTDWLPRVAALRERTLHALRNAETTGGA